MGLSQSVMYAVSGIPTEKDGTKGLPGNKLFLNDIKMVFTSIIVKTIPAKKFCLLKIPLVNKIHIIIIYYY